MLPCVHLPSELQVADQGLHQDPLEGFHQVAGQGDISVVFWLSLATSLVDWDDI